jgi:uncharacterized LabA/DUF88 family protein
VRDRQQWRSLRFAATVITNVYIDGFNFYYAAVKGTPYKWLNFAEVCRLLLPRDTIHQIKYFTALISARPSDPDQPVRQQTYLRALRTIPNLSIIYGHFLTHTRSMPLASSPAGALQYVDVIKTEEKGSDVNLATHLLNDGYKKDYEQAVVVSNDSDLVEPIRIVRAELGLPMGVLTPQRDRRYQSKELRRHATFMWPIRMGVLQASQFPYSLTDSVGTFHKPVTW